MTKYLFGDLVRNCKEKVDRDNNPYEYFVAGDHMETERPKLTMRGRFDESDVGPAFIRMFKQGKSCMDLGVLISRKFPLPISRA